MILQVSWISRLTGLKLGKKKSDLDLLVDSKLRGLKFVGFIEAVRQAVGISVDIFDVAHIEKGSRIDQEIKTTGVTIYEK